MVTVGYGDITPYTWQEKVYLIVMCLISCCIFGYSLNQIGEILKNMAKKTKKFRKKLNLLSTYMNSRDMSYKLQSMVKKYFEYLHQEQLSNCGKGGKMLNQLNGLLKE